MKKYKIHEIFYSLQGEGLYSGTPIIFIRFFGCNLSCDFCDTPQKKEDSREMTAEEVWSEVEKFGFCERVPICLTGGEPLLQVDENFLSYFTHYKIHLETNGTIWLDKSLSGYFTHVTVSPKRGYSLNILFSLINELKFVYTKRDEAFILSMLTTTGQGSATVSPMGDERRISWKNAQNAGLFCLKKPQFRLSLQLHKILNIK